MSYSYDYSYNRRETGIRPASPASLEQKTLYYNLCKRKNVKPQDISKWTKQVLAKEIERLIKLPNPATNGQKNKIRELQNEIVSAGLKLNPLSDEKIEMLNFDQASTIIEKLIEYQNKNRDNLPPSEEQLNILVSWYLCPDIPFENLSSEKEYQIKSGANEKESQTITITINKKVDLGSGLWRKMTPDEFAEELKTKLTRRQASKFISQYRGVYFAWKKTRCTPAQREHIRKLEERLATLYVPRQVEMAVDINGEIMQVTHENLKAQYNPIAHEPLKEEELLMLSKTDAMHYIDILTEELERKNNYKEVNEESMGWGEREWLSSYEDIMEENRTVAKQHDALHKEMKELDDLIYAFESLLGERHDEVHELITESLVRGDNDKKTKNNREKLKEFFLSYIKSAPFSEGFEEEYNTVKGLCEAVPIAYEILTGVPK